MCRVDKQIRTRFSHFASGCHFLLFPLRSPLHSALKTNAHKNKYNPAFATLKQTPYSTTISLAVPTGFNWLHRLWLYPLWFLNNFSPHQKSDRKTNNKPAKSESKKTSSGECHLGLPCLFVFPPVFLVSSVLNRFIRNYVLLSLERKYFKKKWLVLYQTFSLCLFSPNVTTSWFRYWNYAFGQFKRNMTDFAIYFFDRRMSYLDFHAVLKGRLEKKET